MKKIFTLCSVFFIFYFLSFGSPPAGGSLRTSSFISVHAQETPQSALGVSPAIFELVLEPGTEKTETLRIFNVTNFPLPIKASVRNFTPKEEIPEEAKKIYDASSWINIEPADFILQPRENKIIEVTINPPPEAEPGGHYATIYFQPLIPQEALSPQTAYLAARLGVLAFLIVKGEISEEAAITNWQVPPFSQFGPIPFRLELKNSGNIHLLPAGRVIVWNRSGQEVASLPLTPSQVLPQTAKEFTVTWPKKFLVGKFWSQAKVNFGSEQQTLESEQISFWVLPWLPLTVAASLLTLSLGFLIILRKRLRLALKVLLGKVEVNNLPETPEVDRSPSKTITGRKRVRKFFHRKGVKLF